MEVAAGPLGTVKHLIRKPGEGLDVGRVADRFGLLQTVGATGAATRNQHCQSTKQAGSLLVSYEVGIERPGNECFTPG